VDRPDHLHRRPRTSTVPGAVRGRARRLRALRTDDADVALDPRTLRTSESIQARLKAFDFDEAFSGDDRPPVTQYGLGDKDAGFYAEFLTPLVGSENRRDGSADVTERVAGVVAQKVRYLELLLVAPWPVSVSRETGFDLSEPATILVPNPASYLAQKLLIHGRRKPGDRAKDVLYIHDTIELFSGSLPALRSIWLESVAPTLHGRTVRKVHDQVSVLFGSVNDTAREAARIAAPRLVTPTAIREVCRAGLDELLGADPEGRDRDPARPAV
jgi:hypothetical protein